MTLEERVERLEGFIGDMDRITSLYANSLQQICDKYLSLLYIEEPLNNHKEILVVSGFLGPLPRADVPRNVVFTVKASHTFEQASDPSEYPSKIRLKRGETYTDFHLKKYDTENPGTTKDLEDGDYIQGYLYDVYINSQGDAIIASNDAATEALSTVTELSAVVTSLQTIVSSIANPQGGIEASAATIANLNVTTGLTLTNPITLPQGSLCSTPNAGDNSTKIASTAFVNTAITAALNEYHSKYHIIDTVEPEVALSPNSVPDKAIYYRY